MSVYVIGVAGNSKRNKIGHTKNVQRRLGELQTGCSDELIVKLTVSGDSALEGRLHERFDRDLIRGEWFTTDETDIADALRAWGYEVTWGGASSLRLTKEAWLAKAARATAEYVTEGDAVLTPELERILFENIPVMARHLAKKNPLLDPEDIESTCWEETLKHKDELEAKLRSDKKDYIKWDIKNYATHGVLRLTRQEERQARAIKALSGGYEAKDEAFYSPGLLTQLIPAYLDNGITQEPPAGREQYQPNGSDPAESGEWLAMMLDIDRAFKAIGGHHRDILTRYYEFPQGPGGFTHLEIAGRLGIQPSVLKRRVTRAIRAMQVKLGGRSPWVE